MTIMVITEMEPVKKAVRRIKKKPTNRKRNSSKRKSNNRKTKCQSRNLPSSRKFAGRIHITQ
jgi:hypothetical protein